MHPLAAQLAEFCKNPKNQINIKPNVDYGYKSLSVCMLECVYSLRANFEKVTRPVVKRYAEAYMGGDRLAAGDTTSMFLAHIEEAGGPAAFADTILDNHNKSGGVLKAEACQKLARYLKSLHIETMEDFRAFEDRELLEVVVRAVKGIGDAGTHYLFMLAGDSDRCKPDVHIHHCVRDACGEDVTNGECQILFRDTVKILKEDLPGLTVRDLDRAIWEKFRDNK